VASLISEPHNNALQPTCEDARGWAQRLGCMNAEIKSVLSLWIAEAISSDDVVAWADRMILANEEPHEALFELSLKGPEKYLVIPSSEVPHPEHLSFLQEFSIRTSRMNLSVSAELERFVEWASQACLGQDMNAREVLFSYDLFFLYVEYDDIEGAKIRAQEGLPELLESCRSRAAPFWIAYAQQAVAADRADRPRSG
jgi:hypothetical protein